jgi:hypothetical protein
MAGKWDKKIDDEKQIQKEAERKARAERDAYRMKLIMRLLGLLSPARRLNVSKLKFLKESDLVAIGQATRQLHQALEDAGLNTQDTKTLYNNRDF